MVNGDADAAHRRLCEGMPWVINFTAVDEAALNLSAAVGAAGQGDYSGVPFVELQGEALPTGTHVDFYGVGNLVINLVVGSAMVVAFALLKHRYDHTRVRTMGAPLAFYLALVAYTCTDQVSRIVGTRNLPCWANVLTILAIVPFLGAGLMVLYASFFTSNLFSKAVAKYGRITDDNDDASTETSGSSGHHAASKPAQKLLWTVRAIGRTVYLIFCASLQKQVDMTPRQRVETLRLLKFAMSGSGQFSLLLTFFVFMAVFNFPFVFAGEPAYANNCYGCVLSPWAILFCAMDGTIATLLGMWIAYRARKLRDPWHFRRDALLTVVWALCCLCFFVTQVSVPVDALSVMMSIFFLACIAQNTVVPLVIGQRNAKQEAERRAKSKAAVGASANAPGSVTVSEFAESSSSGSLTTIGWGVVPAQAGAKNHARLLGNPVTKQPITDWITSELSSENLTFLEDTAAWVGAFNDIAPSARLARAKRLYKAYVEPGAIFQVNVDDRTARAVAASVASLDTLTREAFDDARVEAARMLE